MKNQQEKAVRIKLNGVVVHEGFKSLAEAMEWAKVFITEETSNLLFETYQKEKLLLD
jgi:hypothetical protein|tara:strand:+ start:324 stop:494 length:171 start_codon:yes stop_codon:yes gene_type:complete